MCAPETAIHIPANCATHTLHVGGGQLSFHFYVFCLSLIVRSFVRFYSFVFSSLFSANLNRFFLIDTPSFVVGRFERITVR